MQTNSDFDTHSHGISGLFLREVRFNLVAGKSKSSAGVAAAAETPSLSGKVMQDLAAESFAEGPGLDGSLETDPSGDATFRMWGINE
jgi:hypothetical protein